MLQKFALAVKAKTIEFFAEGEEEDEDAESVVLAAPEEVITGQRVVVLKPDPPPLPDPGALLRALSAALDSFRAAYLQLQSAHSPLLLDDLRAADRSAVSLLRRLSDIKSSYFDNSPSSPLSTHLQAQVQDNQILLRGFETAVNRLQADIDRKDAEAASLKRQLHSIEAANSKMERTLERACLPPGDKVEAFLTVGMFNSVLKDACRATHRFAAVLIELMKNSNWDLASAANSIYPAIVFAKPGHCQYAILSYICLRMFEGFDSYGFCCTDGENGVRIDHGDDDQRTSSLRKFIEHSEVDAVDLVGSSSPNCDFSRFCKRKYQQLVQPGMETLLFGSSDNSESMLGSFQPSSPVYEPFVNMANSIWMLHKLAQVYDPVVEIFQVGRGVEFSMVYMENITRRSEMDYGKELRPKVGFTVIPGFRVGKTVIQCRVYLDVLKQVS